MYNTYSVYLWNTYITYIHTCSFIIDRILNSLISRDYIQGQQIIRKQIMLHADALDHHKYQNTKTGYTISKNNSH